MQKQKTAFAFSGIGQLDSRSVRKSASSVQIRKNVKAKSDTRKSHLLSWLLRWQKREKEKASPPKKKSSAASTQLTFCLHLKIGRINFSLLGLFLFFSFPFSISRESKVTLVPSTPEYQVSVPKSDKAFAPSRSIVKELLIPLATCQGMLNPFGSPVVSSFFSCSHHFIKL